MKWRSGCQILKSRDDHLAVALERSGSKKSGQLTLSSKSVCSWAEASQEVGPEELRPRIEPWLTALVQSEHLSLLVGSGLTHAVHGIATKSSLPGMATPQFGVFDAEISAGAARLANAARRAKHNFEDAIRAANDLTRGLEILATPNTSDAATWQEKVALLKKAIAKVIGSFTTSILESEYNLISAKTKHRENAFNYLVNFLMSFASRSGTRERLHIFTTNYDRYIEAGADIAGLRLIDRFIGTLSPLFRASRLDIDLHYNPPGIRGEPRYLEGVARYTKLHGSIDWIDSGGSIRRVGLPFGAKDATPYMNPSSASNIDARHLMVHPNSAKDRETTYYPYVELFRDFAAAICRPNSTLICYGYSFGDDHINRIIEDMLTIPSTHLVIISYGDPLGRIMRMYKQLGRHAQFTLLIGDHLGDLKTIVDRYLPKPAIDRTTFRMAELLKARWDAQESPHKSSGDNSTNDGKSAS